LQDQQQVLNNLFIAVAWHAMLSAHDACQLPESGMTFYMVLLATGLSLTYVTCLDDDGRPLAQQAISKSLLWTSHVHLVTTVAVTALQCAATQLLSYH
jgi:hypothetical protein